MTPLDNRIKLLFVSHYCSARKGMPTMIKAVEKSSNSKTGCVSATYAPIASCPADCPLKDRGCYAKTGNVGIHVSRLDRDAVGHFKQDIAENESKAIDGLSGKRPLRLHVSGDCATTQAARTVSAACDRYTKRHGQPVWAYTHAWRKVPRAAWGSVSVWARVHSAADVKAALRAGYAVNVVKDLQGAKMSKTDGVTYIACPATRTDKNCLSCKLCFKADRMREKKIVIAFPPHGPQKKAVAKVAAELWEA